MRCNISFISLAAMSTQKWFLWNKGLNQQEMIHIPVYTIKQTEAKYHEVTLLKTIPLKDRTELSTWDRRAFQTKALINILFLPYVASMDEVTGHEVDMTKYQYGGMGIGDNVQKW